VCGNQVCETLRLNLSFGGKTPGLCSLKFTAFTDSMSGSWWWLL